MDYLISGVVFFAIFSLLILIHEWGHFYAARKAGVKIEEFGLGLPPRAKGLYTDKKGTLYSLNWIPFGGFVRMYGEDSGDPKMQSKEGSFSSKSLLARTLIILGGVFMNFLLGFALLVVLFRVGIEPFILDRADFDYYRSQGLIVAEDGVVVSDFVDGSAAELAGLQRGDLVLEVSGSSIASGKQLIDITQSRANADIDLKINRSGQQILLRVPVDADGRMGVYISDFPEVKEIKKLQLSLPQAIVHAGSETARLSWATMKMFVQVIFDLFTRFELSEQVSGPVGIASLTHHATQNGLIDVLKLIALLSISLGAINVIPIPALDGGRFLSILFELVSRRRPNAMWEARIHAFGFVLLIVLIFAVTYQDIVRLITQWST
ncbi:MAG: M50 family metallopeptidase [bacterium]|nr:M50 family metallopeptidase [bacterium]